jgi:hypothetical protein
MSKMAIGENVDNAVDDNQSGTVIAVFPTVDGNFRYCSDLDRYGAFKSAEEGIVPLPANLM